MSRKALLLCGFVIIDDVETKKKKERQSNIFQREQNWNFSRFECQTKIDGIRNEHSSVEFELKWKTKSIMSLWKTATDVACWQTATTHAAFYKHRRSELCEAISSTTIKLYELKNFIQSFVCSFIDCCLLSNRSKWYVDVENKTRCYKLNIIHDDVQSRRKRAWPPKKLWQNG